MFLCISLKQIFGIMIQISQTFVPTGLIDMEALRGHVKFLKKVLYLLIRTYASPN